jgi:hypothetical protein
MSYPLSYAEKHAALVTYLKVKTEEADWHGVSDAANDLRVLEASQPQLLEVTGKPLEIEPLTPWGHT